MFHLSEPIHKLQVDLRKAEKDGNPLMFDVVVIGSGYGGAVAAARFAEAGLTVLVLERGKEYVPGEFPNNLSEAPSHVRIEFNNEAKPWGYEDGLFDIRIGGETATILGNALGGGSQINANVALEPDESIFEANWPSAITKDALKPYFEKVRSVIGVTDLLFTDAEQRFPKARALGRLAANAGDTAFAKKPLLVRLDVTPLAVKLPGLEYVTAQPVGAYAREVCTGCGNCVSGCNVGAKGTLTMNYLPIAKDDGAQIYTGATALAVEKVDDKWRVTGIPTSQRGRLRTWEESLQPGQREIEPWVTGRLCSELTDQFFEISATRVVISAGTLGTAEILHRSMKGQHKLTLSKMLGKKFSGNGDYLAFSYGQSGDAVNAVGWSVEADVLRDTQSGEPVGPTITATLIPQAAKSKVSGIAKVLQFVKLAKPPNERKYSKFILQDGAIPGPIGPGVRELWAFANAFSGSTKLFDPIALHPQGMSHTQTFLGMGEDAANGTISANDKTGRVSVSWPGLKDDIRGYGEHICEALKPAVESMGGTYLENPTWKLLPPFWSNVFAQNDATRGVNPVSHPLGGCVMADLAENGVVDDCGRVFSANNGKKVHAGLYVLDGSIIHGSVGKNPFLTIAALAERAVKSIIDSEKPVSTKDKTKVDNAARKTPAPKFSAPIFKPRRKVGISLSEILRGSFQSIDGTRMTDACLDLTFSVDDFESWLSDLSTKFTVDKKSTLRVRTGTVVALFSLVEGSIRVFDPKAEPGEMLPPGGNNALWQQPKLLKIFSRFVDRFTDKGKGAGILADPLKLIALVKAIDARSVAGARRVLVNSLDTREIVYDLTFQAVSKPPEGSPRQFKITGGKHIAFNTEWSPSEDVSGPLASLQALFKTESNRNIFRIVTQPRLHVVAINDGTPISQPVVFKMDLADTLHRNLPQILTGDTSQGLVAFLGYPMVFLRFTICSLLLNFRAPDYELDDGLEAADRRAVQLVHPAKWSDIKPTHLLPEINGIKPMLYRLPDSQSANGKELHLFLWRYEQKTLKTSKVEGKDPKKCKAVLMLHAFGQSALSFADATIDRNGATVLHKAGYDVWLLEYRTSTALDGETKAWHKGSYVEPSRRAATMDEVAEHDIPTAIKFIRNELAKDQKDGKTFQIFAFAQCVGSASLAMSALNGKLKDTPSDDKGWLAGMVLSQFMPYCIAGEGTQARTSVPAFLRDVLRMSGVNFSTLDTAREAEEAAAFVANGVTGVMALKGKMPPRAGDAYASTMTDTLIDVIAGVFPTDDDEVHHRAGTAKPNILQTQAEVTCRRIMTIEAPLFRQMNLSKATFQRMPILFGHANIELFDHARRCIEYERLVDKDGHNIYVTQENIVKNLTMPICLVHGEENDLFALESSIRSARLIAGFRGDKGVYDAAKDIYDYTDGDTMRTIFLPGLGHLDPIIGNGASEVFDKIVNFFDNVFNAVPPVPAARVTRPPTGGNTLGYVLPVKPVTE